MMSPPHPAWELRGRANFKSRAATKVDAALARKEWLALARSIESLGGTVAVLPPSEDLTGLPFAAEAGHPLPPLEGGGRPRFILPRMKAPHREKERDLWKPFVERLGFEIVEIEQGYWEGQGDVATFDRATLLFWGGRTDYVGMQTARAHFPGEVLELNVWEPALHGNMAVLPLDHANACLVSADVLHEDSLAILEARVGRDRMHFVSEEEIAAYSTNGLVIGDTVLTTTKLPERVRALLVREGMKTIELSMTELCEKAGGAARCLVCRFENAPSNVVIPEDARLARYAAEIDR